MPFNLLNKETAPETAQPLLDNSIKAFGMIPNLHGVLANSPAVLEGYQQLHQLFMNTGFDNDELTVVWQTINVENACHYCVPAHTAIANGMKVDQSVTKALRNRTALPSAKLQALHLTTLALLRNRGQLSDAERKAFNDAGYTDKQLLDIVLGIAQKTISNYTNHLANTPIDEPFKAFVWEATAEVA